MSDKCECIECGSLHFKGSQTIDDVFEVKEKEIAELRKLLGEAANLYRLGIGVGRNIEREEPTAIYSNEAKIILDRISEELEK